MGGMQTNGTGEAEARIYEAIFESVMKQQLLPGTRLPEAALSKLFGVSRTIVRQVLRRLAHDNLVELRPNRGAMVAKPTPEDTRKIFEARRALESAIVSLVVRNAKKPELAALKRQLAAEHDALGRADQSAWTQLASGFHLRLAELAGNPILRGYLVELMSRCSLIVALYERPGNAPCEHDEHARIVQAIERGDAAGAAALMTRHLDALESRISLADAQPARSLARMLGFA